MKNFKLLDSLLQVFDDIDQLSDDKLQDLKSNHSMQAI